MLYFTAIWLTENMLGQTPYRALKSIYTQTFPHFCHITMHFSGHGELRLIGIIEGRGKNGFQKCLPIKI